MLYFHADEDETDPFNMKRRFVTVRVCPSLVARFGASTRPGESIIIEGVPSDAQFCGMSFDPERNCFLIRYRHPSFPVVPDGHRSEERSVSLTVLTHKN